MNQARDRRCGGRGFLAAGRREWSAIRVIAGSLAAVAIASCGPAEDGDPVAERELVVEVLTAEASGSYTVDRTYVGRVEPRRRSRVGFDQAGLLLSVHADEGDRVGAGAVLARLDRSRLEARMRELEARVEEARTAHLLARSTERRIERAAARNAVSALDVDQARQGTLAALAAHDRARASRDLIEIELGKTILRSPFTAVVAERLADEGQVLAAGVPLIDLLELDRPRVRVGVPAEVAKVLAVGDEVSYWVSVAGERMPAKLLSLLPEQSGETRTVDALFELDKTLASVRAGESAELSLERVVSADGFWLPMNSLTESSRGLWSCYVAAPAEDGDLHVLQRRHLEVIELSTAPDGGSRAFVRGGLAGGEQVVVGGLQRLVPDLRVRPRRLLVESTSASGSAEPPR